MDHHDSPAEISVEQLLEQDIPELTGFHKGIALIGNIDDIRLFSHPARLRAMTVLVCLRGEIDCSINLKNYRIGADQLLVCLTGDIIRIHGTSNMLGYAVIISEEYLQQLQLDFRLRTDSILNLRDNGPTCVPHNELMELQPYYVLLRKNMENNNGEVVKGLVLALCHTILGLLGRYRQPVHPDADRTVSRAQQLFDKFMRLLTAYHTRERSLKFYADKMCLTPKYVSVMVRNYSGRAALDWINEYVTVEAKMMLRYTDMSVQEIAYSLNFPTQSAFGKYFKQQAGMGPRQYRLQN